MLMKKLITLTCVFAMAVAAQAVPFVSQGNGTTYTFTDLAAIESCGVKINGNTFTVDSSFTISAGDVLKINNNEVIMLGDKVQISIDAADFCPADTATITATEAAQGTAKGFKVLGGKGVVALKNLRVEYVGFTMGFEGGHFEADNCTFTLHNTKSASGGVLNFSKSEKGMKVTNCTFVDNKSSGVASGSNTPVDILISKCEFRGNTTENRNRPQINMTCGNGYGVTVEDCVVIGGHYTLVGGIAVSNLLGMSIENTKVVIKNNIVRENRYGINITGSAHAEIIGNTIVDNIYETNPQNGGSAISVYDAAGKGTCKIRDNYMENNLWGITIPSGAPAVDAGNEDEPGNNVFKNNGNGDPFKRYEFFNNGTATAYAIGNDWNSENPEDLINGDVIWRVETGIADVDAAQVASVRYFNINGVEAAQPFDGVNIVVTRFNDGTTTATKVIK